MRIHPSVQTIVPIIAGATAYVVAFLIQHAIFRLQNSPDFLGFRQMYIFAALVSLISIMVPIASGVATACLEKRRAIPMALIAGAFGELICSFFFTQFGAELAGPRSLPFITYISASMIYQAIICAMAAGTFCFLRTRAA